MVSANYCCLGCLTPGPPQRTRPAFDHERLGERTISRIHNRTIEMGSSMAELTAARVLSDHYREVSLAERDQLHEFAGHRRGVPQGRRTHGLLASGRKMWEIFSPDYMRRYSAAARRRLTSAGTRTGASMDESMCILIAASMPCSSAVPCSKEWFVSGYAIFPTCCSRTAVRSGDWLRTPTAAAYSESWSKVAHSGGSRG